MRRQTIVVEPLDTVNAQHQKNGRQDGRRVRTVCAQLVLEEGRHVAALANPVLMMLIVVKVRTVTNLKGCVIVVYQMPTYVIQG